MAFVFVIVMSIITCPFTAVLNALVMIAVKIKRRLRTKSNIAIACLAATDGLMGLVGQPIFIAVTVSLLKGETSNETCTLQQLSRISVRLLAVASLFHLVLMNVERYMAIKRPFEYEIMVTEARILCSSGIAWGLVVLNIPLIAAGDEIYLPANNTIIFLSVLIIIFCQVTLYCETRRQEKQIAAQQVSLEARQKFLKEKKALKVTTTVLFFLILSYLPVILCRILVSVVNSVNAEFVAFFIACFLLILNSLINPIIYCLRIRQFRVAFIEIVFCKNNFHAENIEMRVFGTRNAVLPAFGEAEAGLEGQNNDQENSNSSNNNHSRATGVTTGVLNCKAEDSNNSGNSNNSRSINDQRH